MDDYDISGCSIVNCISEHSDHQGCVRYSRFGIHHYSFQRWTRIRLVKEKQRRDVLCGSHIGNACWIISSHSDYYAEGFVKRKEVAMDDTAKEKKIIWIVWATITAIVYIASYLLQSEEILIKGNLAIGLVTLLFPCSNLFVATFCSTNKEEDMAIGILMLFLAFVSCCLSAFVVIAKYIS